MEPEFCDGDIVLIEPTSTSASLAAGDVVVARHPFKNVDIIKTIASVDADDHVRLASPSGDDSRRFGRVAVTSVRGRVTLNLSRSPAR